jgi:hypothetical protein
MMWMMWSHSNWKSTQNKGSKSIATRCTWHVASDEVVNEVGQIMAYGPNQPNNNNKLHYNDMSPSFAGFVTYNCNNNRTNISLYSISFYNSPFLLHHYYWFHFSYCPYMKNNPCFSLSLSLRILWNYNPISWKSTLFND